MAVKDFDITENSDRSKKPDAGTNSGNQIGHPGNETNTEIKNAHASGTGSIGSNESRLPEEEVGKEDNTTAY